MRMIATSRNKKETIRGTIDKELQLMLSNRVTHEAHITNRAPNELDKFCFVCNKRGEDLLDYQCLSIKEKHNRPIILKIRTWIKIMWFKVKRKMK